MGFFFPGEGVSLPPHSKTSIGIGAGPAAGPGEATQAGALRELGGRRFWINSPVNKYIPLLDDLVIGIVHSKGRDSYKVDIGAPHLAALDALAFPNCTKRNRPNLGPGDAVFVQVMEDQAYAETRVTASPGAPAVAGLGHLASGVVLHLGILKCRSLLLSGQMEALGKTRTFSAAVGMNGLLWIDAPPSELQDIVRSL